MEEMKEFEVGDFIEKSEVYTSEGSSKYRRMAQFCNENGLVMKEDTICMNPEVEQVEDEINIDVYIIAEPDPVVEPVPEEAVPPAPQQEDPKVTELQERVDALTIAVADIYGGRRA